MIDKFITGMTAVLCLAIFIRLFFYQRNGAQFRRAVSVCAWALMASAGSVIIKIMSGELLITLKELPLVVFLAVLALSVFQCKGNVSALLRGKVWDAK